MNEGECTAETASHESSEENESKSKSRSKVKSKSKAQSKVKAGEDSASEDEPKVKSKSKSKIKTKSKAAEEETEEVGPRGRAGSGASKCSGGSQADSGITLSATSEPVQESCPRAETPPSEPVGVGGNKEVRVPPATGEAADFMVAMSKFHVRVTEVGADGDMDLAWSYPPGCARDNSVEVVIVDAEMGWRGVTVPTNLCNYEGLGISVDRRYIGENTEAGVLRFTGGALSGFADGCYFAVLVDKLDTDVARAVSQRITVSGGRVVSIHGQPRMSDHGSKRRGSRARNGEVKPESGSNQSVEDGASKKVKGGGKVSRGVGKRRASVSEEDGREAGKVPRMLLQLIN